MGGVGAADQILYKVIAPLHVLDHVGVKRVKTRRAHLGVVFPPDGVRHAVGFDDMFVFGGSAGEFSSGHQERAALAQSPFATLERGFNQSRFH